MEQSAKKISSRKTQPNSNYEVECIEASDTYKEAMWLYRFTGKLEVTPSNDGPAILYSTGAIAHAKKPKSH